MINGTEIKALCVQESSAVYRERKGAECPFLRYESFSGYTDTGFDGHISKYSKYQYG